MHTEKEREKEGGREGESEKHTCSYLHAYLGRGRGNRGAGDSSKMRPLVRMGACAQAGVLAQLRADQGADLDHQVGCVVANQNLPVVAT